MNRGEEQIDSGTSLRYSANGPHAYPHSWRATARHIDPEPPEGPLAEEAAAEENALWVKVEPVPLAPSAVEGSEAEGAPGASEPAGPCREAHCRPAAVG